MLVNRNTAIIGPDVILVPYRTEHVEKYHRWMLSPELRELTASEPLTLEEEYAMQRSWQIDDDKLTFIILARPTYSHGSSDAIPTNDEIKTYPMIGDVNLFFKGIKPHSEEAKKSLLVDDSENNQDFEVEAEVMLAEPLYRRNGLASQALSLLFSYATSPSGPKELRLSPQYLIARIGESNLASIKLFEKLGFTIFKKVDVFKEVEMKFQTDHVPDWVDGKVVEFQ